MRHYGKDNRNSQNSADNYTAGNVPALSRTLGGFFIFRFASSRLVAQIYLVAGVLDNFLYFFRRYLRRVIADGDTLRAEVNLNIVNTREAAQRLLDIDGAGRTSDAATDKGKLNLGCSCSRQSRPHANGPCVFMD